MKNKSLLYVGSLLFVGLFVGYAVALSTTKDLVVQTNSRLTKNNCLTDDCLLVEDLDYPVSDLPMSVQDALDEAIKDEYKALAVYESVIAKFGSTRPFSMITGAEEQHIASLKAIYIKHGLVPPVKTLMKIDVPATLQESCQIGVDAEVANAALYKDELLPLVVEYEDITIVFENLMNASIEKHLPAFERCK